MYIQDEGRLSAQLLCQSIERKNKKKAALPSMSLVAVESDYYQKSVSAPVKLSETQARWVGTRATLVYFGRNLCVCMCVMMLMIVCLNIFLSFSTCLRLVYVVER